MQAFLIVGLAFVLGWWLLRSAVKSNPQKLAKLVRGGGGAALALAGVVLSLRGGIAVGGPMVLFGLGLLGRELNLNIPGLNVGGFTPAGSARKGQRSTVRTEWLAMELDHDTGAMDGDILAGRFAGRRLSELAMDQLRALRAELAAVGDQSRLLLDAYLDRTHPDWRAAMGADQSASGGAGSANGAGGTGSNGRAAGLGRMTRAEASRILEVPENASEREIRSAHRRLMKKFHPDAGGSDAIAALINQAKDVLLQRS